MGVGLAGGYVEGGLEQLGLRGVVGRERSEMRVLRLVSSVVG